MSKELTKYDVNFPAESKIETVDCSTKTVHNHYYGKAKSIKQRAVYISLVSLTVILVTVGITLRLTSQKISQKDIHVFEPIQIYEERGGATLRGINFYNKKKFYLALQEFNNSNDTTDFVMFYKANCLMYINNYDKARQYLDHIGENSSLFIEDVEWLTALSFYYQEKMDEAIVYLTDISVKDHKYKDKASKILSGIYEKK